MTDARRGLLFFLATMAIFAVQDGVSKLLALTHSPIMIVMIRYWAFAAFAIAFAAAQPGGLRHAVRTRRPLIHAVRGVMLAYQIMLFTYCFAVFGLAESHAVYAVTPLLVAAMGLFFLKETLHWSQWLCICAGLFGVLILMDPSRDVFDLKAFLPFMVAILFAAYSILTRWQTQEDGPIVSFFYTGVCGAIGASLIGPFFWTAMAPSDWLWMAFLCIIGISGHYLLIKAYEKSEAGILQPFAYLQPVAASVIGVVAFSEVLEDRLLIGAAIVIGAGLVAHLITRHRARGQSDDQS